MTLKQTEALNRFLAASGLTKEELRSQLNEEAALDESIKAREIAAQLEAEKVALKDKCFAYCTALDWYYFKVISAKASCASAVTCIQIPEHPDFYKCDDGSIGLYESVITTEVDLKSFQYFSEISPAEFEEAMMTWVKELLLYEIY